MMVNECETYTVISGYELTGHDLMSRPNDYSLIGMHLDFVNAAHIVRTLLEHGEPDM